MLKFLLFVALAGSALGKNLDVGVSRIVGGVATTIEKRPYQASLLYTGTTSHRCGASIITTKHLLTAAHCYTSSSLSARVGSTTNNAGGQLIKVQKFVQHPSYTANIIDYDFAVITLASEVVLGPTVQIVSLAATTAADPAVGSLLTVSGWGVTSESATSSPTTLREANIPLVDRTVCKQTYSFLTSRQICLGGTDQGMLSACFGDSGGPCVLNGIQYGLVSGGSSCELPKVPGLYARIASGREWIDQTVAANP